MKSLCRKKVPCGPISTVPLRGFAARSLARTPLSVVQRASTDTQPVRPHRDTGRCRVEVLVTLLTGSASYPGVPQLRVGSVLVSRPGALLRVSPGSVIELATRNGQRFRVNGPAEVDLCSLEQKEDPGRNPFDIPRREPTIPPTDGPIRA